MTKPDWRAHLAPGERLLWTGRPRGGVFSGDFRQHIYMVSTCFFVLVVPISFPAGPILGVAVVLFAVAFPVLILWLDWKDRRHAQYAVTDAHILVFHTAPVARLSWITRSPDLEQFALSHFLCIGKPGHRSIFMTPGALLERWRTGDLFRAAVARSEQDRIVLLDLPDAVAVLRTIRAAEAKDPPPDGAPTGAG